MVCRQLKGENDEWEMVVKCVTQVLDRKSMMVGYPSCCCSRDLGGTSAQERRGGRQAARRLINEGDGGGVGEAARVCSARQAEVPRLAPGCRPRVLQAPEGAVDGAARGAAQSQL